MALSDKQKAFCDEYLKDLNGTQAAKRAGYSARTAGQQAGKLLKKAEIKHWINYLKDKRSERTKIDADWLLKRLADEAEADVADLYDKNNNFKPVCEWPKIWRQGLVAGITVEEIKLGGKHISNILNVKLSDRVKRLELVGKHVQVKAFEDNINVNVTDALADRMARAKKKVADAGS